MELHFIILTALCAILLLFIIMAICAYCCGDLCCSCGSSSSYSHSRESYNETVTTGTKSSSKGEYHSEQYSNNGQILPSKMPLPQHDFEMHETDESQTTPLLVKDPRKRIGFEFPGETPEEVREIPHSNGGFYPPSEVVAIVSPQQQDTEIAQTSHHAQTVSYSAYPPNVQSNSGEANGVPHSPASNSYHLASTAQLPNKNASFAPARLTTSNQPAQNIETVRHVKSVPYTPYPPSKQIYSSDIEANEISHSHQATKNISQTETQVSRIVATPSSQTIPYQQDQETTETAYHVEKGSFAPYPPSTQIYSVVNSHQPSENTSQVSRIVATPSSQRMPYQQDQETTETSYHVERASVAPYPSSKQSYPSSMKINQVSYPEANSYGYAPIKKSHYASDSEPTQAAYFTRSGSYSPSDISTQYESTTRNYYPSEPRRNKTHSTRTITYSSENIAPYPVSIRVANSVELLPSSDSDVPHGQTQAGRSPFKKHPSQVSLYDNV